MSAAPAMPRIGNSRRVRRFRRSGAAFLGCCCGSRVIVRATRASVVNTLAVVGDLFGPRRLERSPVRHPSTGSSSAFALLAGALRCARGSSSACCRWRASSPARSSGRGWARCCCRRALAVRAAVRLGARSWRASGGRARGLGVRGAATAPHSGPGRGRRAARRALTACMALGMVWMPAPSCCRRPALRACAATSSARRSCASSTDPAAVGPILNALARLDPLPADRGPAARRRRRQRRPSSATRRSSARGVASCASSDGVRAGHRGVGLGGGARRGRHQRARRRGRGRHHRRGGRLAAAARGARDLRSTRPTTSRSCASRAWMPARSTLAPDPRRGEAAAILGYPQNGPYRSTAARLGDTQTFSSQDAYGRGPVSRDDHVVPRAGAARATPAARSWTTRAGSSRPCSPRRSRGGSRAATGFRTGSSAGAGRGRPAGGHRRVRALTGVGRLRGAPAGGPGRRTSYVARFRRSARRR